MTHPAPTSSTPPVTAPHARLVAGHVAVLAATVPLAVATIGVGIGSSGRTTVTGLILLACGFAAGAAGQVLAIRRLHEQQRHLRTAPLPPQALLHGSALIGWSTGLSQMPVLLGLSHFRVALPPAPLLAALGALTLSALLLDHAHADWTYRQLPGHRTPTRVLEPRSAARIRSGQRGTAVLHLLLALVSIGLLVLTALSELRRPDPAPLVLAVQVLAALAGIVLVLAALVPVERVHTAVATTPHTAVVHLPHLDAAARSLGRIRRLAAPVAALTAVAVLLGPADPSPAVGRLVVLFVLLVALTLGHASLTPISLGTPAPTWPFARPRRRP